MRPTARCALIILLALSALAALAAESSPAEPRVDDLGPPAAGKARVVFFRATSLGDSTGIYVLEGDKVLGFISHNTFFTHECEPGKHEFIALAENVAFLDADLLPGRNYYVHVALHPGAVKSRVHFETVRKDGDAWDEFQEHRGAVRYAPLNEARRAYFEQIREAQMKKLAKWRVKKKELEIVKPDEGYEGAPPGAEKPAS